MVYLMLSSANFHLVNLAMGIAGAGIIVALTVYTIMRIRQEYQNLTLAAIVFIAFGLLLAVVLGYVEIKKIMLDTGAN